MSDTPPVLPKTTEAKPSKKFWGVLIGVVVGVLCELGGYLLMRGSQNPNMNMFYLTCYDALN
jgi:hypothetical protein